MKTERGFGLFHVLMIIIIAVPSVIGWQYYQKQQAIAEAKAAVEKERVEIKKSVSELVALYEQWRDAEKVAISSPRIAMANPIAKLQEVRRQTAALGVTPCLATAKSALADAMAIRIDGLLSFMAGSDVGGGFEEAASKFFEFAANVRACKEK